MHELVLSYQKMLIHVAKFATFLEKMHSFDIVSDFMLCGIPFCFVYFHQPKFTPSLY